jgi:MFS transporter, DHA1 family, inner membrane transport protein
MMSIAEDAPPAGAGTLPPKRERALLWLLAFTQFTVIMDFMVMMPLGPQVMNAFSIGPAAFATAVSAYAWCAGLSGLLGATYIDRFDRRKLLLWVYLLFALSNLACALAPSFLMLQAGRAFAGITAGVLGSVVMAVIGDVIPQSRRGEATGIVMTSLAMAAVFGVPVGILLGAHFGWPSPFYMLAVLSTVIWLAALKLVPTLTAHLRAHPVPLSGVLPDLVALLSRPAHVRAFILTSVVFGSSMVVIPFISPVLVANHGVQPAQLSWLYMAGGAATLYSARVVGRVADRYGLVRVFRIVALFSIVPMLFVTHLPAVPYIAMLALFPLIMVSMSGRGIPMQALMTTVPQPAVRGAFLSVNSAVQSLGVGVGAWLGGVFLSTSAGGEIVGYGTNGWVMTAVTLFAVFWVGQVVRPARDGASRAAKAESTPVQ